jgi:hypothetical protein
VNRKSVSTLYSQNGLYVDAMILKKASAQMPIEQLTQHVSIQRRVAITIILVCLVSLSMIAMLHAIIITFLGMHSYK